MPATPLHTLASRALPVPTTPLRTTPNLACRTLHKQATTFLSAPDCTLPAAPLLAMHHPCRQHRTCRTEPQQSAPSWPYLSMPASPLRISPLHAFDSLSVPAAPNPFNPLLNTHHLHCYAIQSPDIPRQTSPAVPLLSSQLRSPSHQPSPANQYLTPTFPTVQLHACHATQCCSVHFLSLHCLPCLRSASARSTSHFTRHKYGHSDK